MAFALFTYPVTRPVPLRFIPLLIIAAILTLAIATIFNFAAAGFESIQVISNTYENHITLWYQRFVPRGAQNVTPEAWKCNATIIKAGDGFLLSDSADGSAHHRIRCLGLLRLLFCISVSWNNLRTV
jgi:hypothetical protein